MAMFAIASIPLIKELSSCADIKQLWYADDASAFGSLVEIRKWWDGINTLGRSYGYFPNAAKTTLLVKDAYNEACEVLEGSGVNVVTDGVNVLGCPIGVESFVQSKADLAIEDWCREVELLAEVAIP